MTRDSNTITISDRMENEELWYFKSFYQDRQHQSPPIEILKEYIQENHCQNDLAAFVDDKTDWTFIIRRLMINYL